MLVVDTERCIGCGACVRVCPVGAIKLQGDKAVIDDALCEDHRVCQTVCPENAILIMEIIDPAIEEKTSVAVPAADVTQASQQAIAPSRDTGVLAALIDAVPRVAELVLDWLERRPQKAPDGQKETRPEAQAAPMRQNDLRGTGRQRRGRQGKGRRQRKWRHR